MYKTYYSCDINWHRSKKMKMKNENVYLKYLASTHPPPSPPPPHLSFSRSFSSSLYLCFRKHHHHFKNHLRAAYLPTRSEVINLPVSSLSDRLGYTRPFSNRRITAHHHTHSAVDQRGCRVNLSNAARVKMFLSIEVVV